MIDGTYQVAAHTPLGSKEGTLVLACEGEVCNAELTVLGKTAHLTGSIEGDTVTFRGTVSLPFPLGKQDFELVGGVTGNKLEGTCSTQRFSFGVSGTRIS